MTRGSWRRLQNRMSLSTSKSGDFIVLAFLTKKTSHKEHKLEQRMEWYWEKDCYHLLSLEAL